MKYILKYKIYFNIKYILIKTMISVTSKIIPHKNITMGFILSILCGQET